MMRHPEAIQALQRSLNYTFSDPQLLTLALTHSAQQGQNNQRLEFLGDAILGAVASKKLYEDHPDWDEGDLSVARTAVVCKDHLSSVAHALNLSDVLIVRKDVARSGPVHAMPAVLADALEAIVGAIFLDGGYEAAFNVASRVIIEHAHEGQSKIIAHDETVHAVKDAKTRLQEYLQSKGFALPNYRLVKTEGPPNDCIFFAECFLTKPKLMAEGTGRSRKSAEQVAAELVIQKLHSLLEP